MPEITIKALVLGIVLSAVLAGANAYLGLLAGMTVSASIPAAVISMAVLRMFRRSNILENNIVQTAASAGESLAAGVIFTFPALLLLGVWTDFSYWQTTIVAALGGLLGVLFTIPLRRALIVDTPLKFPEGVATAEVLEVGQKDASGVRFILGGAILGGLYKLGETGLGLWQGSVQGARRIGGWLAYGGTSFGPALAAVGYIIGLNISVLVFLGGAINWLVAIPVVAATQDPPAAVATASAPAAPAAVADPIDPLQQAKEIHSNQTKFIGVGAMLIGGLWAIIRLWPSLVRGVGGSLRAYRQVRRGRGADLPRQEQDVPIHWVSLALLGSLVPLYFLFRYLTGDATIAAVMAGVLLAAGFLFSAVAGYMAGLVGSSSNPVSGVTLATILVSALLLLALGMGTAAGPMAAILIGAVVCCAAAIGGDNMQDLKTGHLVGATPWKQQVMQAVGVLAAALVLAPILSLLHNAYGIATGEPGALEAPQADVMAKLAGMVFDRTLNWRMMGIGMGVAVALIAMDLVLQHRKAAFRTPVLAVAVGIYLPLRLSVAILLGGLVAWAVHRSRRRSGTDDPQGAAGSGPGILLAAGLITGEALLGILLAIPLVIGKAMGMKGSPLEIPLPGGPQAWPGALLLVAVLMALFVAARKKART